eukprot:6265590-Amphidinium_carterae.1
MLHGMAQHLTGLNAYPSCQVQSISFGHDLEVDPDDPDWGSSVIFAKVQADLAQKVESLLANEVVPNGATMGLGAEYLAGCIHATGCRSQQAH